MDIASTAKLNNGVEMPYFGLGVWQMKDGDETLSAVKHALKVGYRHIDTAQYYENERSVGKAVRESGIPRETIFVTSKLTISNFGYDDTFRTFDESLARLGFEYMDLFLLHFPVDKLRIESWKALEEIYTSGKVKAIGVSNFTINHLNELMEQTDIIPTVNQVEFSPYLYQKELHEFCKKHGIQLEAYSPITKGKKLNDPKLMEIADRYNKTAAQILVRWHLQHEIVVIPKSSNPQRIEENADVFDFEISQEDMNKLDTFNENHRTSWNPEDETQVKMFSHDVIRKLSKLTGKLSQF